MEVRTDFVAGADARDDDHRCGLCGALHANRTFCGVLKHESNTMLRVDGVCFNIAIVVLLWVCKSLDNSINPIAIGARAQKMCEWAIIASIALSTEMERTKATTALT